MRREIEEEWAKVDSGHRKVIDKIKRWSWRK